MTNLSPVPKTLSFHQQKFALQDSEGNFVSLADLGSWKDIPWSDGEISAIDLGDLPCRLSGSTFALALQNIWRISADDAIVKIRIPHPRHDVFLHDLGYIRPLLPETLGQLNPRHSPTGLATQLGVRFEILETAFSLDPHWQQAIGEEKLTYEDIQLIAKQALNVIEWIDMQLQVKKSLWVETTAAAAENFALDASMRQQLLNQLQAHTDRGDEQSAAVIQQFLNKSPDSFHSTSGEKV
jgi:hypothetical protein